MSLAVNNAGYAPGGPVFSSSGGSGNTFSFRFCVTALNAVMVSFGATGSAYLQVRVAADATLYLTGDGTQGQFVIGQGSVIVGEWYWITVTINASTQVRAFIGKPRWTPPGILKTTVQSSDIQANPIATMSAASGLNVTVCGFSGAAFGSGKVSNLMWWPSLLTDSQIASVMQPGVTVSSAWGTGGLPAAPSSYYVFSSTSDLTDHLGSSAAFVIHGTITTGTEFAAQAKPSQLLQNVADSGDSLTFGSPQNLGGYPSVLASARPSDTIHNFGHPGFDIEQWQFNMQADVMPAYDPAKSNVAIVMIGINNVGGAGTFVPATMYSLLATGVNFIRAMGFNVIVFTLLPAGLISAPGQAVRTAYNALILGGTTDFDWIENVGNDPYYVPSNSAIYQTDQLHLVQATGYTHLATDPLLSANHALNGWLGLFAPNPFFYGSVL